MSLLVLFESSAGYALLEVVEAEEAGSMLPEVQAAKQDLQRFSKSVKLKAFQPFSSAESALLNMNAISESLATKDLRNFLELNLPKSSKKRKGFVLGVAEPALGNAICEELGLQCRSDDTIREVLRGVRYHFSKLIKGLDKGMAVKTQLGLGHAYSRAKVKTNPARSDNMVIQSIALLDQLDKDLNTFTMRVREWYCWHFPELRDLIPDGTTFCRCASLIGDRATIVDGDESFVKSKQDKLEDILGGDETKSAEIVKAAKPVRKISMGMDASPIDILNVVTFTDRIVKLADYRRQLYSYLCDKMATVAPNLSTLIGELVAARLISKAGSLTSLAKCPASTVQILGAEKALFRALKTKGNTPKYGIIYHSTFIGRAGAKNKGRISRVLANKCSIASRVDAFIEVPTTKYGAELREQLDERLRFYDTGEAPRRNVDAMQKVAEELKSKKLDIENDSKLLVTTTTPESNKKKKKQRKSVEMIDEGSGREDVQHQQQKPSKKSVQEIETPKKKKKKEEKTKA